VETLTKQNTHLFLKLVQLSIQACKLHKPSSCFNTSEWSFTPLKTKHLEKKDSSGNISGNSPSKATNKLKLMIKRNENIVELQTQNVYFRG